MDPDMNKYDLNHRVAHHAKMSDVEWEDAYRSAWQAFYTTDHIRTILRRAAASRLGRPGTTLSTLLWFKLSVSSRAFTRSKAAYCGANSAATAGRECAAKIR